MPSAKRSRFFSSLRTTAGPSRQKTHGNTFYSTPDGDAESFYGIPIVRVDGRDAEASYDVFGRVVAQIRADRKPAIVVFQVKRLNSHTNADDQRTYRTAEEIEETRKKDDPIPLLRNWLQEHGVPAAELEALAKRIKDQVLADSIEAKTAPIPSPISTPRRPWLRV